MPGDVVVSQTPDGTFLIRRATTAHGLGEWWEYVGTVASQPDAVSMAIMLATQAERTAWWHQHDGNYTPIDEGEREPGRSHSDAPTRRPPP